MPSELSKYFEFSSRESEIYTLWLAQNVFKPESAADPKAPVFSLAMPPPNANGELHLGHVFGEVTMDVLGRYQRALGKRVLLVPGKDHAGIQTQVVYERKLRAEGIDPQALGRDAFYKRCYDFCIDRSAYMRAQEQLIGTSADWDRELFTLDPRLIEIVYETFTRMWDEGLVYRGSRIVNWSVYSQTAISDVEVEYREEKGSLWYIRYPFAKPITAATPKQLTLDTSALLKTSANECRYIFANPGLALEPGYLLELPGSPDSLVLLDSIELKLAEVFDPEFLQKHAIIFTEAERQALQAIAATSGQLSFLRCLPPLDLSTGVVVATTRPETMLGDSAVVYHPQDPRYAHLAGAELVLPLQGRRIPLLPDSRADMFYGTGVVKVTPAHDFIDYEIGQDQKLEIRQVIDKDGKMTALAGSDYAGLSVKDARAKVLSALEASSALLRTTEIKHKVPVSERGKDVIEPLIAEQWWVAVDKPLARFGGLSLKQRVLELLALEGPQGVNVYPAQLRLQLVQWFNNLKDWNISRQIWWGPRIPVWYEKGTGKIHVGAQAPQQGEWTEESDTFDTWFSSGQWAYSTMAALKLAALDQNSQTDYFPTHTMVMGRDILFFWACRMLLLTAYRQNSIPWKNIYFTGLIRDQNGQKMSKSKGNGIEPTEMIKSFGADALRLAMIMGTSAGSDANIGPKKIEGYSKAINKLWNAAKLLDLKLEELGHPASPIDPCSITSLQLDSSNWLVAELQALHASVGDKLARYELAQAIEELYQFFWFEYCDWYLEMLKPLVPLAQADTSLKKELYWVASETFRSLLVLLHPFIPFVTEEIFQRCSWLRRERALPTPVLALEPWQLKHSLPCKPQQIAYLKSLVLGLRSVKAATGKANNTTDASLLAPLSPELSALAASLAKVQWVSPESIPQEQALKKPFQGGPSQAGIVLCRVDSKPDYRQRLERELLKGEQQLQSLERKLSGDFVSRADPELVRAEQAKLADYQRMLGEMRQELALM
jgi:valyl-tRNA synthetase